VSGPLDWISIEVGEVVLNRARALRALRDERYGNIFGEAASDMRWIGEVGEIIMAGWLAERHTAGAGWAYYWATSKVCGEPDFWIGTSSVDVKTVKRASAMKPEYTAQVTARHTQEDVDYFFFTTYIVSERKLLLLGGIDRAQFLSSARYYGAGQWVHTYYQIRPGHEIYNIGVANLTPPLIWLGEIAARASATQLPCSVVRIRKSSLPLIDRYTQRGTL